jgi:integrase
MRKGENIYRRKDKRWEARYIYAYDENGRAKYRYIYGKTYAEAKRKLRATAEKPPRADEPQAGAPFIEAAVSWLNSARLRVKDSTWVRYRGLIEKHLAPRLGKFPINKISAELLERFVAGLLDNGRLDGGGGLSEKTVQDIVTVIKSVFKYAKCYGGIDWTRLRLKKARKEMRVLTRQEQSKLNAILFNDTDAEKLGVLLSLYTGIRVGELCALRWDDIDLTGRTLQVRRTLQRIQSVSPGDGGGRRTEVVITVPKSECAARVIPLPDFLFSAVAERKSDGGAFVLTGDTLRYTEPRVMQNRFKKYVRLAGIEDANYHATRHTFATRCVELGFEIKSLSEILGHSSVKITLERYVHSSFDLKRANMDKLSAAVAC